MATGSSLLVKIDNGFTWIFFYFLTNLGLTIYNKAVFQFVKFHYPFTLTMVHCFFSCLGCFSLIVISRRNFNVSISRRSWIVLILFSFLYTINISVSNVSLGLVTLSFHQIVRSTTPVFVILISILFTSKSYSLYTYLSLIPVVGGVALATYGDISFTMMGFLLTIFGTFLAALKTVVTNVVLVGDLKMDQIDLLLRMSFLAFFETLFFAVYNGEIDAVMQLYQTTDSFILTWVLISNGLLAFCLNVVSFTANKKTSALSMTVAANVKQVLIIVLAIIVFSTPITASNTAGIIITIVGGALYTMVEYREKNKGTTTSMA